MLQLYVVAANHRDGKSRGMKIGKTLYVTTRNLSATVAILSQDDCAEQEIWYGTVSINRMRAPPPQLWLEISSWRWCFG